MRLPRCATAVWLVVLLAACGAEDPGAGEASALERLGVPQSDAERYAVDALATGQPYGLTSTAGRAFNALADGDRAAVIEGLAHWAQQYFASDAFQAAYAEHRSWSQPQPPELAGTVDEAMEQWTREGLEQIEETRRSMLPLIPEADRPEMLASLDELEAQFSDSTFVALQRQSIEMQRASDQMEFEASLEQWHQELPEDPNALIRRHLQAFLDVCADVDFDAELVEQYGLMRFANPDYERRPWAWKACFRAGEASVEAARTAAQAWLDDLG